MSEGSATLRNGRTATKRRARLQAALCLPNKPAVPEETRNSAKAESTAFSPSQFASLVVNRCWPASAMRSPDTRGVVAVFGLSWTSEWIVSVSEAVGDPAASASRHGEV